MKTVAAAVTAALTLTWPVAAAAPAFSDERNQNGNDLTPSALALRSVPRTYLNWYQQAAHTCHGLSWQVLAGIGELESGHGQSTAPGVHADANYAGAQGPMQFEPATFAAYAVKADAQHPLSVYNPEDAIFSAAKMLCANGASSGTPDGLQNALLSYNHASWYPPAVLSWASRYATTTPVTVAKATAPHKSSTTPAIAAEPMHKNPAGVIAAAGTPALSAQARDLLVQARQLAAEAARLSELARQLATEAHQLSAKAPAPVASSPAPVASSPAPVPSASASASALAPAPASAGVPDQSTPSGTPDLSSPLPTATTADGGSDEPVAPQPGASVASPTAQPQAAGTSPAAVAPAPASAPAGTAPAAAAPAPAVPDPASVAVTTAARSATSGRPVDTVAPDVTAVDYGAKPLDEPGPSVPAVHPGSAG